MKFAYFQFFQLEFESKLKKIESESDIFLKILSEMIKIQKNWSKGSHPWFLFHIFGYMQSSFQC